MGELGDGGLGQSWGGLWAIDPAALAHPAALASSAPRAARTSLAVAIVDVEGALQQRAGSGWLSGGWDGYDAIADRFSAALASDSRAVVLRINSPGGAVAGCFEAVRAMREAKAASGKPVVAYVDEAAFSAAYALATVADGIYLPRSGAVGSVGVIATRTDLTGAAEKAGIKVAVVSSGGEKSDGHPMTALDAIERERLQARVNELAGQFAELVATGRGMSAEAVLGLEAGTRSGADAVRAGLADGVAGFSEVVQLANERGQAMSVVQALRKSLGLAEAATEADVLAAVQGRVELVASVFALTAQTSPEAARGVIEAWKRDAGHAATLNEALGALEAKSAEREKRQAVKALLKEGKITPGLAWKDGDKDKGLSDWAASQTIESLRAFGRAAAPLSFAAPAAATPPDPDRGGGAGLSAQVKEVARRAGVTPEKWLEAQAELARAEAIK